jgi:hypothetical protein
MKFVENKLSKDKILSQIAFLKFICSEVIFDEKCLIQ